MGNVIIILCFIAGLLCGVVITITCVAATEHTTLPKGDKKDVT
jgi:hypothetical protein